MYLQQLLNGVCCQIVGVGNPQITSLSCDTSTVKQGSLFFCLKGQKRDGHDFFRKVIGDGASAIVCERPLDTQALQIIVEDARAVMSLVAKNFYDNCVDKLKIISIVGTNGKTSTSYILEAILSKAGYNTAVIGTNGIFFNGQKHYSGLTTPDPIELHYWFRQMYLNKVDVVIMEVSAHAIELKKMQGICAEVAIFTNFSQDHLDFFKTMQNYATVLGVDVDTSVNAVKEVNVVNGRNETIIRSDGARVVIDFAHTPDGIHNILSFLKSTTKGRLIVVFGCGGNRDKFKRPSIAEQFSEYADFAVLTNDNPRYEDPKLIAKDVAERLTCKYKVVLNRSQATEFALSIATAVDTVAILGKGAEEYQEIKGKKFPYSDVDVVRNLLRIE